MRKLVVLLITLSIVAIFLMATTTPFNWGVRVSRPLIFDGHYTILSLTDDGDVITIEVSYCMESGRGRACIIDSANVVKIPNLSFIRTVKEGIQIEWEGEPITILAYVCDVLPC